MAMSKHQRTDRQSEAVDGQDMERKDTSLKLLDDQISQYFGAVVFLPDAPFRRRWDMLVFVLIFYFLFVPPLRWAFNVPGSMTRFFNWMDVFSYLVFLLDILVNFRTASKVKDGVLNINPKFISRRYRRTWFKMDFVAAFPLDILLLAVSAVLQYPLPFLSDALADVVPHARLVAMLRVMRLGRITGRIEHNYRVGNQAVSLIKPLVSMFLLLHWVTCLYWAMSSHQGFGRENFWFGRHQRPNHWVPPTVQCNVQNDHTLIEQGGNSAGYDGFEYVYPCDIDPITEERPVARMALHDQYAVSIFWALGATVGVGRDLVPHTQGEHLFTIAVVVLGLVTYALVVGMVIATLQNRDVPSRRKLEKISLVHEYCNGRRIPQLLQKQIRDYYEYMWSTQQSVGTTFTGIVDDLHGTLKLELYVFHMRRLIKQVPMFNMVNEDVVIELIEKMTCRIYLPGEYIIKQGDHGHEMYIIREGRVHVYAGKEEGGMWFETYIRSLSDGEVFGERSLLTLELRNASVISPSYCNIMVLNKHDFDGVMYMYPEFLKAMHSMMRRRSSSMWGTVRDLIKLGARFRMEGKRMNYEYIMSGKYAREMKETAMIGESQ